MVLKKILLTGGSGTLGTEIIKLINNEEFVLIAPSSNEMDITNFDEVKNLLEREQPDTVVHAAAYTDVKKSKTDLQKVIDINIIGACNLVKICSAMDIRLVFISTDHVFDGEKGFYKTDDLINPITVYAKSKASAEIAVRMYDKSLVIRTSFFKHTFPYEKAFVDQWSSKDYVDKIAPKVVKRILSEDLGIVHCASDRKTMYDIAKERRPEVQKSSRKDFDFFIPKDTSLL